MRIAVVCLSLAAVAAGCGGRAERSSTDLTIVAVNSWVGRAMFHVRCGPAGGDVPKPSRACGALAAEPDLITSPEPYTCFGGAGSWWDLTISGRLDGEQVSTKTSTCWTPQMRLIGKLGIAQTLRTHLVPRRVRLLLGRSSATFAPGALRSGDLVKCLIDGRTLEQGVPVDGPSTNGFGGKGIVTVELTVSHRPDGSVSARCA